jgi:hypothetical protein
MCEAIRDAKFMNMLKEATLEDIETLPPFHCPDCGEYFGNEDVPVCQCNSHFSYHH